MSTTPIASFILKGVSGASYKFKFFETLRPDIDDFDNEIITYQYSGSDVGTIRNQFGKGLFCEFSLKRKIVNNDGDEVALSCVYLWLHKNGNPNNANDLLYIGKAEDLKERFKKYGHISPSDCRDATHGGNSTNCKMNKVLMKLGEVDLYVYPTATPDYDEEDLLKANTTQCNERDN